MARALLGRHSALGSCQKATFLGRVPFLLPHEVLGQYMATPGVEPELPALESWLGRRLASVCSAWGEPAQDMLPVALHGDGVPAQGRMNQTTLDFLTWNMPSCQRHASLRIPICCLDAKWNAGEATIGAIWTVVAWSFRALGMGQYPGALRDDTPWGDGEGARGRRAGRSLRKAAPVFLRAGWDYYCKWLGAPQFNVKRGMCWLRTCKPAEWRLWGPRERRGASLSKAEFLAGVCARGKVPAAIFELPGVTNHPAGVRHPPARAAQGLWDLLQRLYDEHKVPKQQRLA